MSPPIRAAARRRSSAPSTCSRVGPRPTSPSCASTQPAGSASSRRSTRIWWSTRVRHDQRDAASGGRCLRMGHQDRRSASPGDTVPHAGHSDCGAAGGGPNGATRRVGDGRPLGCDRADRQHHCGRHRYRWLRHGGPMRGRHASRLERQLRCKRYPARPDDDHPRGISDGLRAHLAADRPAGRRARLDRAAPK